MTYLEGASRSDLFFAVLWIGLTCLGAIAACVNLVGHSVKKMMDERDAD